MPLSILNNQRFNTGGAGYVTPGSVGFLGDEGSMTVVTAAVNVVGPGTYDNVFYDGGVYVSAGAGDYTFTNCVFQGKAASWLIFAYEGGTSFTFEDCTFRWKSGDALDPGGQGVVQNLGVSTTITLRRCDVSGKADGLQLAGTATVEDCYIHDLVWAGTPPDNTHNDGIQFYAGDLTVTGCYFDVGALFPYSNSCLFFQGATIDQVLIEDTFMAGGGYSYYVQNGTHTVRRCTFGEEHLYGTHYFEGTGWTLAEWSSNVNHLGETVDF